jgi:DNA-binding response OmpR family regulator
MRLLLAEDDDVLGRATCVFMLRDGHAVDWVTDGNQLLALLPKFDYDCVVLDLGLPEIGGDDCLKNMRLRGNATPVIVTTARGFLDDRIGMLDLGADDYLVKPYDLAELSARIKAVVRRNLGTTGESAPRSFGPLVLMPEGNAVRWHDKLVTLTVKEYWVLDALLKRRGRAVTRQQLEEEVYGWNETVASNSVEVHVHNLRKKLGAELIQTVRGIGYQIDLPS